LNFGIEVNPVGPRDGAAFGVDGHSFEVLRIRKRLKDAMERSDQPGDVNHPFGPIVEPERKLVMVKGSTSVTK